MAKKDELLMSALLVTKETTLQEQQSIWGDITKFCKNRPGILQKEFASRIRWEDWVGGSQAEFELTLAAQSTDTPTETIDKE